MDGFSKKCLDNLRDHFLELADELFNRIWSVYCYCYKSV